MRLGLVWSHGPGANYRAMEPLKAMHRRGHEVVWPLSADGAPDARRLAGCDVVHVYRRADQQTRNLMIRLKQAGTAITYDNDDDLSALPLQRARQLRINPRAAFAATLEMARLATTFTTTTEVLAGRYQEAGVTRLRVIGNYLALDADTPVLDADSGQVVDWRRNPGQHRVTASQGRDEVVLGWVAGLEHRLDANRLRIASVLRDLLAEHDQLVVDCVGVDLGLRDRYRHWQHVHFAELPRHISGYDIGIAPLADAPFNRARSDIKVKEYAAAGVPWIASPVGPYAQLSESEGGLLVADDDWFEALDELLAQPQERARLAKNALDWAERNTISAAAPLWEQMFLEAAALPRSPA